MRYLFSTIALSLAAAPAFAATKNIFSAEFYKLSNTDFIVLVAFIVFIGVIVYLKVPSMIGGMLDKRADTIRSELDEAKALREEAQTLLASYERKQREVADQAKAIVEHAKEEAGIAAEQAKLNLASSVERRLQAAEDRISSAEASALKNVRDQAVGIAVAAAGDVLAKQMSDEDAAKLIDESIKTVEDRMH
jgi:F-type H+-transporting ATPase subunit b